MNYMRKYETLVGQLTVYTLFICQLMSRTKSHNSYMFRSFSFVFILVVELVRYYNVFSKLLQIVFGLIKKVSVVSSPTTEKL